MIFELFELFEFWTLWILNSLNCELFEFWTLWILNSLKFELFEAWTLQSLNSLNVELVRIYVLNSLNFELCNLSLSYVWMRGVILSELIVSDNLKLNERNYFRFPFWHLCAVNGTQGMLWRLLKVLGPICLWLPGLSKWCPRLFRWCWLFMCVLK